MRSHSFTLCPVPYPVPAGLIHWQPGTSIFQTSRGPGCCWGLAFSTRWGDGAGHWLIHGRCFFLPEPISAFWCSFALAAGSRTGGLSLLTLPPQRKHLLVKPSGFSSDPQQEHPGQLSPAHQLPFVSSPMQLTPKWAWKPSRGTALGTSSACTRCTTSCSPVSGWTRPSGRAS